LLSTPPSHSSRPSTGGSGQPSFQSLGQPIGQQSFQPPGQQPFQPGQQPFQPFLAQGRPNEARPPSSHAPSNTPSNLSYASPALSVSNYSGSGGSEVNRTGSPTSITEHRVLHVTNASTDGFMFQDAFSSSSSSAAAAAAAAATVTSSSSHEPQRDGKGRLRRPSLGKAPLVHLDGGRIQQQLEAATSGARPAAVEGGPAPPAYEA